MKKSMQFWSNAKASIFWCVISKPIRLTSCCCKCGRDYSQKIKTPSGPCWSWLPSEWMLHLLIQSLRLILFLPMDIQPRRAKHWAMSPGNTITPFRQPVSFRWRDQQAAFRLMDGVLRIISVFGALSQYLPSTAPLRQSESVAYFIFVNSSGPVIRRHAFRTETKRR